MTRDPIKTAPANDARKLAAQTQSGQRCPHLYLPIINGWLNRSIIKVGRTSWWWQSAKFRLVKRYSLNTAKAFGNGKRSQFSLCACFEKIRWFIRLFGRLWKVCGERVAVQWRGQLCVAARITRTRNVYWIRSRAWVRDSTCAVIDAASLASSSGHVY